MATRAAAVKREVSGSPSRAKSAEIQAILAANMKHLEPVPVQALYIGEEIGKGRFKKVHRGRFKRKDVVILRYSKENDSGELGVLAHLSKKGANKYVPEIYGVCYERSTTSIVQEIAEFGALKGVLKSPEYADRFTTLHKLFTCVQIAGAMGFLEQEHVVHADLSCRNVLVTSLEHDPSSTVAKITDFGLSAVLPDGEDRIVRKQPQATRWCAPETIASATLSHKADVWSLGATIWELFAGGTAPWERREKRADVQARLRDLAETGGQAEGSADVSNDFPIVNDLTQPCHEVMMACFRVDEQDRPNFVKVGEMLRRCIQVERGEAVADKVDNGTPTATTRDATPVTREVTNGQAPEGDGGRSYLVERPWSFEGAAAPASGRSDAAGARFKALQAFLKTDVAAQVVTEETLQIMSKELEEAMAREAYLVDMVQRTQGGANATQSSRSLDCAWHEDASQRGRMATYVPMGSYSMSPPPRGVRKTISVGTLPGQLVSPGPRLRGTPSRDLLVTGSTADRPRPIPPPNGMWTLWSFLGSTLRRQDFDLEEDAWVAFKLEAKVGPCMLRDPSGAEAAAKSWVASYFNSSYFGASEGSTAQMPAPTSGGLAAKASGCLSCSTPSVTGLAATAAAMVASRQHTGVSMSPVRTSSAPTRTMMLGVSYPQVGLPSSPSPAVRAYREATYV